MVYEKYKLHRAILRNSIKAAKLKYYHNKFDLNKGSSKKTWQIINELRGKSKQSIKDCFIIDSEKVLCRRLIASKFNSYFVSLARNLNANAGEGCPISQIPTFEQYMQSPVESSIFLEETSPKEVSSIIHELVNGKASDIPVVVLKKTSRLISPILARLYNMTVHNLYNFCCITELFKIIKFRYPIALYELLQFSYRGVNNTILLQQPSAHFLYQSSLKWNTIWKHLLKSETGYGISLSSIKNILKNILLNIQSLHEPDEWTPQNFVINSITLSQSDSSAKS